IGKTQEMLQECRSEEGFLGFGIIAFIPNLVNAILGSKLQDLLDRAFERHRARINLAREVERYCAELLAHQKPEFSLIRTDRNGKDNFDITSRFAYSPSLQRCQHRGSLAAEPDIARHLRKRLGRRMPLFRREVRSLI